MTIVPVSQLSRGELNQLGHNMPAAVRRDRRVAAVNRSLAMHDEYVAELARRPPVLKPASQHPAHLRPCA